MQTSSNDRSNKVTLLAVTVALVAGAVVAVAFSSAARSADLQLDDLADRPATEIAEFAGYEITPEQSAAFSDDAITDSERVEAFDAWLGCVEEAGYRVISSELRYFGESLQVEDPKDTSGPAIRECRERLYGDFAFERGLIGSGIPVE